MEEQLDVALGAGDGGIDGGPRPDPGCGESRGHLVEGVEPCCRIPHHTRAHRFPTHLELRLDQHDVVGPRPASGAEVGRQQLDVVKERAADQLDELGAHLPLTGEQRAEQEARRLAREEAEAQAVAERKKRVDDRLKDY